ncbi:MAG: hypothetical protein OEP95_02900 [Myxococcales bacterium]|nr:hypothetical protein [Myxococcales bacterium]
MPTAPRWVAFGLALAASVAGGATAHAQPVPASTPPSAEACAELERVGLYQRRALDGTLTDLERVRRWLVATNPPDLESASTVAADLSVPADIFALRLGSTSPRTDFRAWLRALELADFSTLAPSALLSRVGAQASAALVSSLEACVARPGLHVWTETTLDPTVLEVHTRYEPGAGPAAPGIERLSALEAEGQPLECIPELPRTRRLLFIRRRPKLGSHFTATCLRAAPDRPVEIRLVAAAGEHALTVPPAIDASTERQEAARTIAPRFACTDPDVPLPPTRLRVGTECAASTGERSRRSRPHSGWNHRAEARSLCPHRDLDAEARASLLLRCRPLEDETVELLAAGELTAHAGWSRRGCVADDPESKTHCVAAARIVGEAASPLWVDLTSRHCLRVVLHEARGTGEPANNGSRKFGPERFEPRYLKLRDPHGTTLPLDPDSEWPLDVPGQWEIVAGGSGARMPGGWLHRATRNQNAGSFRFRQRLRFEIVEADASGQCPAAEATGSAP